jgi:GTPase SAR1 family protein
MLKHPPSGRMPCMLLYGDSNIGKTMIVEKFVRDHPTYAMSSTKLKSAKRFIFKCLRTHVMTSYTLDY